MIYSKINLNKKIEIQAENLISLLKSNDGGKFGTHEILAEYNLTPKRLLEILNDREDITEEELTT